ncbi:MGH1-like glycoside hydrolase domain-containing protein [Nonomuraea sp. CA-143628]|uniref:MGH1-like glycoside hydrolase domain-containing protein n=1 Tax=Nonomuraea sp. CA-143628 TaxID=3239997 RepID=UPI003D8A3CD5
MPYSVDEFAFDLRQSVAPGHTWVTSGWTTVHAPPGSVCGVGGWFAPPYAAPDAGLAVELEVDGHRITDGAAPGVAGVGLLPAGGTWWPGRIVRHGTYHRRHDQDGEPMSLRVLSTLTPLHGQAGFVLEVEITNRAGRDVTVTLHPRADPGGPRRVPLAEWGWVPPTPGPKAVSTGPWTWQAGDVTIELTHEGLRQDVPAGGTAVFALAVRAGAGRPPGRPRELAAESAERSEHRLARALARVPRLTSDIPGLAAYWRGSLASGLVCLWDNPGFITSPFVATSGVDGGALCAYAWDTGGYAPHLLTLMLGEDTTGVLESIMKVDLTRHYAIAPDGTGLGVPYAYSGWSLVTLATAVAAHHGISPALVTQLHDLVEGLDARFAPAGALRDYGDQYNLLEMRSSGWEHVVASPNAERAWCLDRLAELSEVSGARLPVGDLRSRARAIRDAIARELWDEQEGWFRCRYPDGHSELVRHVQAFDAMRNGACTPEMAEAMLGRLRNGSFLAPYGVSAVASDDRLHYELGDTDWSGGGAYTGEGPQLALTLWEQGEASLAWDVMRRLLWMGRHFPYFPQDHYCDRPAAAPSGRRVNIVAGLAGAEAILTGAAGVRFRLDGSLVVEPAVLPDGDVELTGLAYRGRVIDVSTASGAVTVDGRRRKAGEVIE